jgi:cytochrome c biogenesis protein CcdA
VVQLLTVLTPIGLLDSTSIIPLCIVILVVLLSGPRPLVGSTALIAGVFAVYLACGLLVLLGLQTAFDQINTYAARLWASPLTEELVVQVLLGICLCFFGLRMTRVRKERSERMVASGMSASQAMLAGAGLTIVGLPGAVPYFAAIDLTLRAELSLSQRVLALVYYNLVFVAPLFVIVGLSRMLGDRGQVVLEAVKRFFDRWGRRVVLVSMMALGALLVVDGIGWFLGYPLFPL